jgi:nicotinamidase-related amidase
MADRPHSPEPVATIERQARGRTALLIIDMINDMDFASGPEMLGHAHQAADRILALRAEADRLGVPVVYVNDNYGQWHSERSRLVEHCMRQEAPGRELVARLAPREHDYFVIKPMHSGFYATNLPVLLPKLGASRVVLTGIAADICVLFTAADAHMRDYDIWTPRDCVAAVAAERTGWALDIMRQAMSAEVRPTNELGLEAWVGRS